MATVNLKINGIDITAEAGQTILEAARANGIYIPTLCYLKGITKSGVSQHFCRDFTLLSPRASRSPPQLCHTFRRIP